MTIPDSFFGSISSDQFLDEYWQKKPLLVRQAWPGFVPPFTVDEFRALSCREDALARLFVRDGEDDWQLFEGPFSEEDFDDLPDVQWTLLIQEVDRMVDPVHDMLQAVDFLPNWRLDDVMVSYAQPGGGVGAHIDNYDVFLLQGYGRRRWRIDSVPVEQEILKEDLEVRILANFTPDQEWILEPGDMLYLPPRVAHQGEAVDQCMTFSIGCRAPSAIEALSGILERAIADLDPDLRFGDPDLKRGSNSGLIGESVRHFARNHVRDLVADEDRLKEVLGCLLSEPRRESDEDVPEEVSGDELLGRLKAGARLRPISAARGMFDTASDGDVLLFLGGEGFRLDESMITFAASLTSTMGISLTDIEHPDYDDETRDDLLAFLADLVSQGLIKVSPAS